ncbi:hypothetical protein FKV68_33355 (plasmid) [Sinorhizobium mexicanum]|uniref:Uncharacterized protein n=1 Tax=Sinorhizobium mexicanum TaxID=375549 RepID=A0A859R3J7_9HYPH|nr:hypothetical protein FKV68_33355 [Sinorhizobium mexicanum]
MGVATERPICASVIEELLDHDDFGSNRHKIINVIDSNKLRRGTRAENRATCPHPALSCPRRYPVFGHASLRNVKDIALPARLSADRFRSRERRHGCTGNI